MSPEANNPQGPETQNLDTTIHPEGVRPFNADKGDLVDVAPHLEVPQDPSVIDPVTRNVEFDKVELAPAPAAPEVLVSPDPETKKPAGWKKWVAGLVGGAVLAGGGVMAGKAMGGNEVTEARDEAVASAPANPGETTAPVTNESESADPETTGEEQTAEFGLDAEAYAENPEQLMPDFVEAFNTWQNTGVDVDAVHADERFTMTDEEYAAQLNEESDEAFISAMLIPDWQSNPNLVDWVTTSKRNHLTNSWGALMSTDTPGTEESEPYRRYVDLVTDSVVVDGSGEGQIVTSANWTGRDNADQNRVDEVRTGGIDPNGESGTWRLTFFKSPDGSLQLADVQHN
jgi:hypothetical protein